jgi:hypothetical protein
VGWPKKEKKQGECGRRWPAGGSRNRSDHTV